MKGIPAIVQSHIAKRMAMYGQEPEQPLVEELFKRYSEQQSTDERYAAAGDGQNRVSSLRPLAVTTNAPVSSTACRLVCDWRRN